MAHSPPRHLSRTDDLEERLLDVRRRNQWRESVPLDSTPGPKITIGGREYLHLCSNNYLNLASHPSVAEAAAEAARNWGAGAGAARLITGTSSQARELEQALATFKRAEDAVLFSSGYLANIGLFQALARPADWLICDELNHASLIDAARLSRAEVHVYPHGDVETVARLLDSAPEEVGRFVVTDGVFSMDGDIAPLRQLNELAREHDAWLVVDDAHGTGVVGPDGRGACAHAGIEGDHLIQMATLSKALGSQGGAVVGSSQVVAAVTNLARSFVFETALAPPAVAAAHRALHLLQEDPERMLRLNARTKFLAGELHRLNLAESAEAETPIFPIHLGTNRRTLEAANALKTAGYWVTPIRPPTVPEGTARLRVTLMCDHTEAELQRFAEDLATAVRNSSDD